MAKENWASLLTVVRNPLAFFALALLVIEGVVGTIAAVIDLVKDECLRRKQEVSNDAIRSV